IGELRVIPAAIPLKKLIVYQLITPNNDGFNDNLVIENIEQYPVNDLSVFNTEGNLVYRKSNYQNGAWDCSKVIDGNYYYVLNIDGEKLSGHLVVKR
ncbi:MAG: gliding motility-associated C-terminal domain-containing protein, partial [Methylotenera sp.]|nr:gliding motility-associated C-terminal domain-containing protein [Flavobacterium sp.]